LYKKNQKKLSSEQKFSIQLDTADQSVFGYSRILIVSLDFYLLDSNTCLIILCWFFCHWVWE